MQILDSLLVVHNLDEQVSQLWDLRVGLPDWHVGLLKEGVTVDTSKVIKGRYLMDLIEKDETKASDFAYKFFNQKLPLQFH
jgi:hypothetical protein